MKWQASHNYVNKSNTKLKRGDANAASGDEQKNEAAC